MGLTESSKHGHHNNIPIKNPKKGDTRKAYIHTDLRYGELDDFEGPLEDYHLDNEDKKRVMKWVNDKKRRISR